MAESAGSKGPTLLSKIEAGTSAVTAVSVVKGDDSVISASDDKYVLLEILHELIYNQKCFIPLVKMIYCPESHCQVVYFVTLRNRSVFS